LIKLYIRSLKTNKFKNGVVEQLKGLLCREYKDVVFDFGKEQHFNIHFKNGVYE